LTKYFYLVAHLTPNRQEWTLVNKCRVISNGKGWLPDMPLYRRLLLRGD
jgi:hypothetical protein